MRKKRNQWFKDAYTSAALKRRPSRTTMLNRHVHVHMLHAQVRHVWIPQPGLPCRLVLVAASLGALHTPLSLRQADKLVETMGKCARSVGASRRSSRKKEDEGDEEQEASGAQNEEEAAEADEEQEASSPEEEEEAAAVRCLVENLVACLGCRESGQHGDASLAP